MLYALKGMGRHAKSELSHEKASILPISIPKYF